MGHDSGKRLAVLKGLLATIAVILHATASNALPYKAVKMNFAAGYEPHRAEGERGSGEPRPCAPGYYKKAAGAYPCKMCPVGYIAAAEGAVRCTKCLPPSSSDSSHTVCVNPMEDSSERAVRPADSSGIVNSRVTRPASGGSGQRSQLKDWKAMSSKPVTAAPCQDESGAKRCGIPVGYWDNDRTGTVFFPPGYKNKAIPYMLLLHGSGWTGSDMINVFKSYAISYKFAIIAPDSHNAMYWSGPDTAQDPFTADFYHIQACWDAVMKMNGVKVNPKYVSSFGNSRASYAAVAYASRSTTNFNSAAILHAAALPQQMGKRVFPIQWITGSLDPLYGPVPAKIDVQRFRKAKPQYKISWQIWKDNHTIRNYTQIDHMIRWWLDPSIRSQQIKT